MRPRYILMAFGFITAFLSLLALARNSLSPSIMGAAVAEKVNMAPANPMIYFVIFLVIGVIAILVAFLQRKIVY